MVGPISDEERNSMLLKVKVATVLLVGASAGLITTQGDTSLTASVVAVVGGLILGVGLVWLLFPSSEQLSPASNHRRYDR